MTRPWRKRTQQELRNLFRRALPAAASTLVHRGITISTPAGYRFEGAYGGDFTVAFRAEGVLLRFRDADARMNRSVQLVPVPDETDPLSFTRRYLDQRLGAAGVPVMEVPGRDNVVPVAIVSFPGDEESREMLLTLFPLSSTMEDRYTLLLEAAYPTGDDGLRGDAVSIAASLEVPRRMEMELKNRLTAWEEIIRCSAVSIVPA